MEKDDKITAVWYMRVNSAEQLSETRDRSKWHLKNWAKLRNLGSYKVPSHEQLVAVRRKCEEFDRDNRVTMEDVIAGIRSFMHGERTEGIRKWVEANGRI